MKTHLKLMIATFAFSTVLASALSAAVQLPIPGQDDSISRACYNYAGQIVPCKRPKPQY